MGACETCRRSRYPPRSRSRARDLGGRASSLGRRDPQGRHLWLFFGRRRLRKLVLLRDPRSLALERMLERDHEIVLARGRVCRGLAIDVAGDHELDQRLLEGLHLEERTLGDRVGDLFGLALPDQVSDPGVVDQTSTAATRPPSLRGSSRWLTIPRRTPARIERI